MGCRQAPHMAALGGRPVPQGFHGQAEERPPWGRLSRPEPRQTLAGRPRGVPSASRGPPLRKPRHLWRQRLWPALGERVRATPPPPPPHPPIPPPAAHTHSSQSTPAPPPAPSGRETAARG